MLSRSPTKKEEHQRDTSTALNTHNATIGVDVPEQEAPATQDFLETLFSTLIDDTATLKQEMVVDTKDIERDLGGLGLRVTNPEQRSNMKVEELDNYQRELLELCNKNEELQYHLEDLEIRLHQSNIRIKGVAILANSGNLENYVSRLFCHVLPELAEKDIVLDRTHRDTPIAQKYDHFYAILHSATTLNQEDDEAYIAQASMD
ncbi:hypothetical protein NDU88_006138 [Pleurodeles waltl]|uniref:Uncharacterized protein n=1 Tax=Pleurodeles waltl TaxID=8319 RepID=A0AAV7NX93_PLEWA|nr:hypothetical protein NDU88_006138 [Pleurodeles waltl]